MITNEHLEQQFLAMYRRLHQGLDVAPATAFRLEGYMQALIHQQVASKVELLALMSQCYESVYGRPMPEPFPPQRDQSLISVTIEMARAPVE